MKHDAIVDSEAMADVEGVDVTRLLGTAIVIDMQREPQRRAFHAYRVAFRGNQADPNVRNAAELVRSWNEMAALLGLEPV